MQLHEASFAVMDWILHIAATYAEHRRSFHCWLWPRPSVGVA